MSNFTWRLPALMASHNLTETSALRPLLASRGVELSREQVFRLVKYPPERLSLQTLLALCAIFNCTPNDVIQIGDVATRSPAASRRAPKSRKTPIATKRVKLR